MLRNDTCRSRPRNVHPLAQSLVYKAVSYRFYPIFEPREWPGIRPFFAIATKFQVCQH